MPRSLVVEPAASEQAVCLVLDRRQALQQLRKLVRSPSQGQPSVFLLLCEWQEAWRGWLGERGILGRERWKGGAGPCQAGLPPGHIGTEPTWLLWD